MSWKREFQGLYKRLRASIGNLSESALDKRVTREAKNGLTTVEALFVLAYKERVAFSREFRRLRSESQGRINSAIGAIRSGSSTNNRSAKNKKQKTISITLKTPLGQIADPYLPNSIIQEARAMSGKAYPYLYVLENSLRNFISLVLKDKYGDSWWKCIR